MSSVCAFVDGVYMASFVSWGSNDAGSLETYKKSHGAIASLPVPDISDAPGYTYDSQGST